jgi:hypothetical protein
VQPAKCVAYVPPGEPVAEEVAIPCSTDNNGNPIPIRIEHDGLILLGVPVGTAEFILGALEQALRTMGAGAHAVLQLSSLQCSLLLLVVLHPAQDWVPLPWPCPPFHKGARSSWDTSLACKLPLRSQSRCPGHTVLRSASSSPFAMVAF